MQAGKRTAGGAAPGSLALVQKKVKKANAGAMVVAPGQGGALIKSGPPRTSALKAPIMKLSGHEGAVFSLAFSPEGHTVATGGHDKNILLWNVYGDCVNYGVLSGHKNAVLQVCWSSDGDHLFSCSADSTAAMWDPHAGSRVRRFSEHKGVVSSCAVSVVEEGSDSPTMLVTGGDDGFVKVWDSRCKRSVISLEDKYPVTAVSFSKDAQQVYSGSVENDLKVWDLRKQELSDVLRGHSDTVTGIKLSADGNYLLSNARDSKVIVWDVRPFAPKGRLLKTLEGARHSFENNLIRPDWSADGRLVGCGSADRCVYVWDTASCEILYRLPGHKGVANQLAFHPTEPIIGSCGMGGFVYLGEIDPKV